MPEIKLENLGEEAVTAGIDDSASGDLSAGRVKALRRVSVFADLPEDQLQWFANNVAERRLASGEVLFRKGSPAEWMTVMLEGELHTYRDDNLRDSQVYMLRAGDPATEVTGVLPFSRMTEFRATIRAVTDAHLLLFPVRLFPELSQRLPVLVQRLVGIMSDRVRETTKADLQRDKLIALGKLSAGLAHELNNPAAAARRAADELLSTLAELRAADLSLCRHNLVAEQRRAIADFENQAILYAAQSMPRNALEQSDCEEEIAEWLAAHGIPEGWKQAPTLVEAGVDINSLEKLSTLMEAGALGDVLTRITAQLVTAKLASDIGTSTGRISELVSAIKEYTYMDQAVVQEVNLHKGLENTLLILKHKLRVKHITVTREFAADIPPLTAKGSDLNQVWTNLIDNAVDAMSDGGRLKIRTKREPTSVLVEIRDNGVGIPENVRTRIFEPFFTTKPVGEGIGLGLDTVVRIVRQHYGNIHVESKPGDTCFQVRLPLSIS